jgi:hypothetical protein
MSDLKIEVARRQLGTAMDLYLRDLDPVSVHCLANGGSELIEFYAKKLSGEALLTGFVETKPGTTFVELRRIQRQYWNAFKHATMLYQKNKPIEERDDDLLLATFTDEQNDLALVIGWYDYQRATGKMPIEAQAQQAWFFALHPEKLEARHSPQKYEEHFPGLRARSRVEQKRMLNEAIEKAKADEGKMSAARTERRPLVLNWTP